VTTYSLPTADHQAEQTAYPAAVLRRDLAMLRARYDDGAVSTAIYAVIKQIETDISWAEHRQVRP
jgi:hypothetical protein